MKISVGTGHNATNLTTLDPQPEFDGIRYALETYSPGGVFRDAPYAALQYPFLSVEMFQTLNSIMGLTSAEYANITILLPSASLSSGTRYNCQVFRLKNEEYIDGTYYRRVTFQLRFLVAI